MIETISAAFAAGETKTFMVRGEYFETIDSPSNGLTVILSDRGGAQVSALRNIGAGIYVKPGVFEVVQITSVSAQTVTFFVADGDAGTRRFSGNVTVSNQSVFTVTARTVTNGGTSEIATSNANRKYLLVQNKDPSATLWINFVTLATQANGIKIPPGGFFELNGQVTTTSVKAIVDIATTSNIMVVEG